jgi:hypothetical protein
MKGKEERRGMEGRKEEGGFKDVVVGRLVVSHDEPKFWEGLVRVHFIIICEERLRSKGWNIGIYSAILNFYF